ncbi:MAG: beta-ketoacyl synthase N-terminal-like domain-containing protein [Verrucomicrobiales bacterium]
MSDESDMIAIAGAGAVSPAGWGIAPLAETVLRGEPLPAEERTREEPGAPAIRVRAVPKPPAPLPFARDPRLRRASPVARFTVAAALEALGEERAAAAKSGRLRLGVIFALMNGCVNYSRRFYRETLADPATASPIVFPETVFNAPASHLSAMLGATAINYTLVGDSSVFAPALAVAADWLLDGKADGVVVAAGEELDWLSGEAIALFDRRAVSAEGAGALYLEKAMPGGEAGVRLAQVTEPQLYTNARPRCEAAAAARAMVAERASARTLLCDGLSGLPIFDRAESAAWADWSGPRLSPKTVLGDGMGAALAWQCALAAHQIGAGACERAIASAVGGNEQACAAVFARAAM